jgi:hypothetical protein
MSPHHYGLLLGLAASLSLPLAGCGLELKKEYPSTDPRSVAPATAAAAPPIAAAAPLPTAAPAGPAPSATTPQTARRVASADRDDTDKTLWTVLGLARRDSERNIGPQTGSTVSPVLWQATLETLHFAGTTSEDPMTGVVVTNWYSPAGKPDERLRVTVFILSRALRSDSATVTVERQERAAGGWRDAPVAQEVVTGIENAILMRARQIHAERYRNTMYN